MKIFTELVNSLIFHALSIILLCIEHVSTRESGPEANEAGQKTSLATFGCSSETSSGRSGQLRLLRRSEDNGTFTGPTLLLTCNEGRFVDIDNIPVSKIELVCVHELERRQLLTASATEAPSSEYLYVARSVFGEQLDGEVPPIQVGKNAWRSIPQCQSSASQAWYSQSSTCPVFRPSPYSRVVVEGSDFFNRGSSYVKLRCERAEQQLVPAAAKFQQCKFTDGVWHWPYPPEAVKCGLSALLLWQEYSHRGQGCSPPLLHSAPAHLTFTANPPPSCFSGHYHHNCQLVDPNTGRYLTGVTIEFTCDSQQRSSSSFFSTPSYEHYRINGRNKYVCDETGTWQPPQRYNEFPPTCEPVSECPQPTLDKNTFLLPGEDYKLRLKRTQLRAFIAGDQIKLGCTNGLRLVGQSALVCLGNGQWNAPMPRCKDEHVHDRRFIAMASLMAMLLLMLISVLTFVIHRRIVMLRAANQRQPRHHASHHRGSSRHRRTPGSSSSAAANLSMLRHTLSALHGNASNQSPLSVLDADRLALIAYLEEGAGLPTYDEAMSFAGDGNTRTANQNADGSARTASSAPMQHESPPALDASTTDTSTSQIQTASHRLLRRLPTIRLPRFISVFRRSGSAEEDTHALAPTFVDENIEDEAVSQVVDDAVIGVNSPRRVHQSTRRTSDDEVDGIRTDNDQQMTLQEAVSDADRGGPSAEQQSNEQPANEDDEDDDDKL